MADNLKKEISECMLLDQRRLLQRLKNTVPDDRNKLELIKQQITEAKARKARKTAQRPVIDFAMNLPIHERLDEIRDAIENHQLIVLCGETGSGKTTQIPKVCLDMGRGINGLIGHTQPRRIAASSVAERIADELHSKVGGAVGFKIRHTDITSDKTYIKLMTDGILLAELQNDRYLNSYDTLIIDEAHERSLNIDFILGYIKQLLPKRRDLKVIVTSATIDVERFSKHFDHAPVIEISGRTYPVEVRYRPADSDEDNMPEEDIEQRAMLNAIQELTRAGPGDILIFLEGEREIHETAKFLHKQNLRDTDILPLYSRLSSSRQAIIFKPHKRRHIILATNVAETSLTIPGIRYVIDRGYARISRYNRRSKVQQLPTEKISQAAAEQRKGRCGRLADGICIRLYSEADLESRAEFTDPEILRTNLASVILQMKALNLGDISEFPFIEKPDSRYVNDGLRLLNELRALGKDGKLTRIGRQMAKLPLDPRLSRVLLAASDYGCVNEIMIIISALSVNDPRERPLDARQKADEAHAKFNDENSDFLFFLNLWNFYRIQEKKLSQNQLRKLCRQNFISYVRMREWFEVRKQLQELLAEIDIHPDREPSDYNNIHSALLHGFLGHTGVKTEERDYTGARGIKFNIFPGSGQFTKLPGWIVAAELVETGKLYARCVAKIDPLWLLKPAEHLLQKEYSEPYWDTSLQQVMASQKTSLYGLVLVTSQKVNFGKIDPGEARKIFIRKALVEEQYQTTAHFYIHNHRIVEDIKLLEKKSRRHDIYNEEALYDIYDKHLPAEIYNGPLFEKWYQAAVRENDELLCITPEMIMYHEAVNITDVSYPDVLAINGINLPLDYKFEPGADNDGVNIDIPVFMLNQINREQLDYLVPGMLEEKITGLLKALPKTIRKNLVPVPDTARECAKNINNTEGKLKANISEYLFRSRGIQIPDDAWTSVLIPDFLKFNIRVLDESGNIVAEGRELDELKTKLEKKIQSQFKAVSVPLFERNNITQWDFDDIPEVVTMEINHKQMSGYPALVDRTDSVSLHLFDTREKALLSMQQGLKRLFMLELKKDFTYLKKNLPFLKEISVYYSPVGDVEKLRSGLLDLVARQVFLNDKPDIRNKREFDCRRDEGVKILISKSNKISELVFNILKNYQKLRITISKGDFSGNNQSIRDIEDHLNHLVYDGFLGEMPVKLLDNYPRYLQAIAKRIDKLSYSPQRDEKQLLKIKPFWSLYKDLTNAGKGSDNTGNDLDEFRFMLEEFRISLFAQELGTVIPVSSERLQNCINQLRNKTTSNVA